MAPHPRCDKTPAGRTPAHRPATLEARARPASSTSPAFRVARGACVLLALLVASLPFLGRPPVPEAPDAGTPAAAEVGGMTDASLGDEWASLPIPEKPNPGQETRCDPKRGEVSINGGCYLELKSEPPCLEGQYEDKAKGKCYVAVGKRSRPVQSVGQ